MAQHDYSISNQSFPATRQDLNNVLEAIRTNNSGTSAPSTQYAGQFWLDTTSSNWVLYIHDGADDIQFATIDTSANTVNFIDSELGDNSVTTAKIADGNVTSAKLSYPLTTFSSTGIDDNATSTAITIDSSESVGIGETSPLAKLHVKIGDSGASANAGGNEMVVEDSAGAGISILTGNTSKGQIIFGDDGDNNAGRLVYDHSDNNLASWTNGSERMRIDSSGHVIIPAGVTLGTSAGTYNASNTLDDYEEGFWTPSYTPQTNSFTSITYGIQRGSYTKVGRKVTCLLQLRTSALTKGSAGGILFLTGLPFSLGSDNQFDNFSPLGISYNWTNNPSNIRALSSTATARIQKDLNNTAMTPADMNTGTIDNYMALEFTYFTA